MIDIYRKLFVRTNMFYCKNGRAYSTLHVYRKLGIDVHAMWMHTLFLCTFTCNLKWKQ